MIHSVPTSLHHGATQARWPVARTISRLAIRCRERIWHRSRCPMALPITCRNSPSSLGSSERPRSPCMAGFPTTTRSAIVLALPSMRAPPALEGTRRRDAAVVTSPAPENRRGLFWGQAELHDESLQGMSALDRRLPDAFEHRENPGSGGEQYTHAALLTRGQRAIQFGQVAKLGSQALQLSK